MSQSGFSLDPSVFSADSGLIGEVGPGSVRWHGWVGGPESLATAEMVDCPESGSQPWISTGLSFLDVFDDEEVSRGDYC